MIMADVLMWFLIIAGAYLVLNAYWLAAWSLFPRAVEGCRDRYGRSPVRATLLGLVVLVPFLVVGVGVAKAIHHPVPGALVRGILLLPALLALLGSSGLALRIGTGLPSPADAARPWMRVMRGGAVLGLAFLLPFLGWFIVLPFALVSGFGAALLALLARPRAGAESASIPAPVPSASAYTPAQTA